MTQLQLNGYRFVEVQRGDTLQVIAARELGDAARWSELIAYNDLVPPFLTDDPEATVTGVILSGQLIRLPAPVPVITTTADADLVFERDVMLDERGALATKEGDFEVISGRANLRQSIKNRVETDRGELMFHPGYGSLVRRLIGSVNRPTTTLLAAEYAKSAVAADSRIKQVSASVAEAVGDTIRVRVEAEPIVGRVIDVDVEF